MKICRISWKTLTSIQVPSPFWRVLGSWNSPYWRVLGPWNHNTLFEILRVINHSKLGSFRVLIFTLLEIFRVVPNNTLMESFRISILHLLWLLVGGPALGLAADKWMMVTVICLSPGSTKPAVHTIHTRLGGPSPWSFTILRLGWVRLRRANYP